MEKLREDEQGASQHTEWSVRRGVTNSPPHTPFKVSRSFAGLRPLSERLLKPSPQLVCLTLRKLPKVLFKLSLHLVPGAFDLKLVHGSLDIKKVAIVRSGSRPHWIHHFRPTKAAMPIEIPGRQPASCECDGAAASCKRMKDRLLENGIQKAYS
jgi:hypothetical protein